MTLPITEDDAALARILEAAHAPTLLMTLVHLTGDASLLKAFPRPVYQLLSDPHQESLPAGEQARLRALALKIIAGYRDAGAPALPELGRDTVRAMMNYVAGRDVPEHYLPLLWDELGLDARDPFSVADAIDHAAAERRDFRVVIVGAGMSGLLAAIHLKRAGIAHVIIEKNADVGGTWYENSYPGCRVDTPNHVYSYTFEADYDWPQHFSSRDVLQGYFRHVTEKYGLRDAIRFETEVEGATFEEATGRWTVKLRDKSGRTEVLAANAVIAATGQLNRPRLPDIPGRARFAGVAFHSARWQHDQSLKGKRIGVIGTGASAFQFVPEIAPDAERVTLFQRTPPWMWQAPHYHDRVGVGKKWLLDHLPYYRKWFRFWLFWMLTDGLVPAVTADPAWNGPQTAVSQLNDELRQALTSYISGQAGNDAALLAKIIPGYPPGGKRSLVDNGTWLRTLRRPNVEIVTDPIREITARGVVTASGAAHDVDVLIYATGFEASRFLVPMTITGRGGRDLQETWSGDPRAYLGMTIPGFPNFFLMYGPNTNIVVNGSIIFFSECSIRYIMGCLKLLLDEDRRTLECRQGVHDAYNARVDAANALMAWGAPQVSSWYKNAQGRVTQNWPFPLVDYWTATQAPRREDFVIQ